MKENKKKYIRWSVSILVISLILVSISIFSLCIGSVKISIKTIISVFFQSNKGMEYGILFNLRLPRIILGLAVGGALSIAGVLLQGMFHNPLVEPYTLGISGGAALGVCINIVYHLHQSIGPVTLPIAGFLGAIGVVILVYFLSVRKGTLKIQGLLLTGVMFSFISSSMIMFIMAISKVADLHGIIFWIMGSLDEPNMALVYGALIISILGLIVSYFFCMDLNALYLGEEEAYHLGINIENTKRYLFLLSSILTGVSISIVGIIGFVGLVVPHFIRMFIGSDHRILLITSFLSGGAFLIFCDTLARTIIAPNELPVGVITGIIGGILFIYALTKKQVFLGER